MTRALVFSLILFVCLLYSTSFSFQLWKKRVQIRRNVVFSTLSQTSPSVKPSSFLFQSIALNKEIVKTFQNVTATDGSLSILQSRIRSQMHVVSQINAVTLMHRCRKAGIDIQEFLPIERLVDILSVEAGVLSGQGLANAFYSLNGMSAESPAVVALLPVLIDQLHICREVFNGQHTSLVLYGLRTLAPQQSLLALEALESLIANSHDIVTNSSSSLAEMSFQMPSESLACAFLGMQCLSADIPIVERFLSFLCNCMDTTSRFYPMTLSNILLGLRGSPANTTVIKRILHKLHARLSSDSKLESSFSIKEAGVAASALHHMDTSVPEVFALRDSLASMVRSKVLTTFNTFEDVCNVLTSISGLACTNLVVRDSLHRMHVQLASSDSWLKSKITETSLSSCLFAMQTMCDSSEEVRVILDHLADALDMETRLNGKAVFWSPLSLSRAVVGLQSMHGSDALSRVLRHIISRINPSDDVLFSSSEIGDILFGLHSIKLEEMQNQERNNVLSLLTVILPKIQQIDNIMVFPDIARAFFGLNNMNADSGRIIADVARAVAQALNTCYTSDFEGLYGKAVHSQDVIMILRGISNLGPNFYFSGSGRKVMRIIGSLLDYHAPQLSNVQISTALRSLHSIAKMELMPTDRMIEASLISFQGSGPIMAKPPHLPPFARQLIFSIYQHLMRRQEPLTGEQLSFALYGLQHCSPSHDVVWKVVREITVDLSLPQRQWSWDAHRTASAFLGLKCMFSKQNRVRKLILALTAVVQTSNATWNAQAIGNVFYGLQNLQNKFSETRGLLSVLNEKLRTAPHVYNLDGLSGAEYQRAVLHNAQFELNDQNIGNALWGFKKMQADGPDPLEYAEVLDSLELLAERIDESNAQMTPRHIANGLYALQHMSPEHAQVRRLLFVLSTKIQLCKQNFTGLDLGMSLFGLRLMDSNIMEVRLILLVLLQKANFSDMKLTEPELNMSIMGLVNATPWLRDWFLKIIAEKHPEMKLID